MKHMKHMKHLLFQLAAPVQSWGNGAAQDERPTDGHPRKSSVIGLLGAACGRTRNDPWYRGASAALGFAVAVVCDGNRFLDYHTVATPPQGGVYATRREELAASTFTTPTLREYLSDAYFLIAVWQHPDGPGVEIEALAAGLEEPVFELFAGRKACTLSLPPAPLVVDVPTLAEAFRAYADRLWKPAVPRKLGPVRVYWEPHPDPGIGVITTATRRDSLVDLQKRLFRSRQEYAGSFVLVEPEKEEEPCS